ncbi:MAG: hypothetical protein ACLQNE_03655 [Thermoguttaceae bacterium]|jgi:hypothetical protein
MSAVLLAILAFWAVEHRIQNSTPEASPQPRESTETVRATTANGSGPNPSPAKTSEQPRSPDKVAAGSPSVDAGDYWAKPGEKPLYDLPLEYQFQPPDVPAEIARPAKPIQPQHVGGH